MNASVHPLFRQARPQRLLPDHGQHDAPMIGQVEISIHVRVRAGSPLDGVPQEEG